MRVEARGLVVIALSPASPKRQGCGVVPRNLSAFGTNIWHHSQQHKSARTYTFAAQPFLTVAPYLSAGLRRTLSPFAEDLDQITCARN
jgi:hypothetical protein